MITRDEADRILMDAVAPVDGTEVVSLSEATGRVLAEDVASDMDMPPFNRSAMDGFAVRAADVSRTPKELEVVATIPAGVVWDGEVCEGCAVRIMTGAPVPAGATRVIRVEDTEIASESPERVRILDASGSGTNIAPQGQDVRTGDLVLSAGTPIRPTEIGVLSSCGRARVTVRRGLQIRVIATGDELLPPDAGTPSPGQIRESNGVMLAAQAGSLGGGVTVDFLGIARDNMEDTNRYLDRGLDSDVLILSGGVSMGDFDFVHHALHARGMEVLIEKVAIKPGKPFLFGRLPSDSGGTVDIFGLPGNPVSSLATFELFVRPYLRARLGLGSPHRLEALALTLSRPRARVLGRMQHLPARIEMGEGGLTARALDWHGSGDLRGLLGANGFIVIAAGEEPPEAGESVSVWLLEPDLLRAPSIKATAR